MGYEAILAICRKQCDFERFLALARSNSNDERMAGIKGLCNSQNPGAVQPLINALQKDLKERTGVWAWIIPALGASRDPRAVPVLTKTLTLMDEDWLGREMSARALGDIGDPSSIPVLIAAAWRGDTRDAAIKALAKFHDKRVIPVLLSALDPEEDQQTREAAYTGLLNLGSMAVPEMMEAFTDFFPEFPQTLKRLELCRLLAASGDERALSMLRENINDPDKSIRECAGEHGR
jgi:HEAT repeat protein